MSGVNPFPGPQPYRAADRSRFFGRDTVVRKLGNQVLARPATTVYGPSGAGKSSLMQAGVIPALEESDELRVVRVDAWPADKAPLSWLTEATILGLELSELPKNAENPLDALKDALTLAERRSDRAILIYLDQLEQIFVAEHAEDEMKALLAGLRLLTEARSQEVHLVLSIREDYLGRLRDWTRERAELLAHSFRVGPLSVGEMVKAMCRTAAEGDPPQLWDEDQLRAVMLGVRVPGQSATDAAEVQTAFGQIVCRALWEEHGSVGAGALEGADAESILQRYLDATVEGLGGLQEGARKLLEEYLIDDEGHRRLLTEKEARLVLPGDEASEVLGRLERAAVLHAEEHQGSRYFELGHDWLAKKVFERRVVRKAEEAEKRRKEEVEAAGKKAKEQAAQRRMMWLAALAVVVAVLTGLLGVLAFRERGLAREAQNRAEKAQSSAEKARAETTLAGEKERRATLISRARELLMRGESSTALLLLAEVDHPEEAPGWSKLVTDILAPDTWYVSSTRPHTAGVSSATWSPDGTRFVSTSDDNTARVWNADGSGDPLALEGHEARVNSAAWSSNGKRIVTASNDRTARVWNADGSGKLLVLKGHEDKVSSAAWSPDGTRIVTASNDKTARVWNADGSGKPLILTGHSGGVNSAAWSPDGKNIVTTSADKTAMVWNADGSGKPLPLEDHAGEVNSATWSPDGTHIVTTSADKTAMVWNADGSGKPLILKGHEDTVYSAAWSPDSKRIVTGSRDKTARVWNADGSGAALILWGHEGRVNSIAWRADGKQIVTASDDRTARVWNTNDDGKTMVISGHDGAVNSAAWSPNGKHIVTASNDRAARVWRTESLGVGRAGKGKVAWSVAWSPDSASIVIASNDGSARIWKTDGEGDPNVLGDSMKGRAFGVAWSPDSKRIVIACQTAAQLWNADGSGHAIELSAHKGSVTSAAWSPNGARIVTTSMDKTAIVWNADGSGERLVLRGHEGGVTFGAWSPDGTRIVTASDDKTARVWNADRSGTPTILKGHENGLRSAAFSPDGTRIVTASVDETARIWNADGTGAPFVFKDHDGVVRSAAWSPDGRRIVTASWDQTVQVWNADGTGVPMVLGGQRGKVHSAAWSPDGQRVAAVFEDGSARIWSATIGSLQQAVVKAITDCLTSEQRQDYLFESEDNANKAYEACERSHARTPPSTGSARTTTTQSMATSEFEPLVEVTEDEVVILERVQFKGSNASIVPVSNPLLDEIALMLQQHTEIRRLEVQSHSSSEGGDRINMKLTQTRAEAVRDALLVRGVDARRLTAKGYGASRPIADSKTPEGRQKNRRIQFIILERDTNLASAPPTPSAAPNPAGREN